MKMEGGDHESWHNEQECRIVSHVVRALHRCAVDLVDIAILAPYGGQVQQLRQVWLHDLVAGNDEPKDEGGHAHAGVLKGGGADDQLTIDTIDRFQGREKKVVVVTAVRSNPDGRVGHVRDQRRLNVAMTRAECGLVVVCNVNTMSRDTTTWGPYLRYAIENKLVLSSERYVSMAAIHDL